MNRSEKIVEQYLLRLGIGAVVYEPDGNVPPDFLVDGRIAVEARRLNQHGMNIPGRPRGLEELSRPLSALMERTLEEMGPPVDGVSWFVFYTCRRPFLSSSWRTLEGVVREVLHEAGATPDLHGRNVEVRRGLRLKFERASEVHEQLFVLGGWSDGDSGGFVIPELVKSLELCIAEKTRKIASYRERYHEWWLAFDDRIRCGYLEQDDLACLRTLVGRDGPWARVMLVNPETPSSGVDLWSEG